MSKKKNNVWGFFASTKLALFCFFSLAIASIIGTIIPQKEQAAVYIQKYGPKTAELFQILNIPDMYNSWWFMSLLSLFCINLIVCSLDRFPAVWKLITMDNLKTKVDRLKKMRSRNSFTADKPISEVVPLVEQTMSEAGWKPSQAEREGGTLLFSQKTPWVRSGVYIVHVSILVIFIGAIIGSLFGSKGSIMVPEKNFTNYFFEFGTGKRLPTGFDMRVDGFYLSYYDNGSPKEYRSDLTVFENGQEVLKKSIVVNDPLQYNGFTFYQSSYEALNEYLVTVQNQNNGLQKTFIMPPGKETNWAEAGVTFGIVNLLQPDRWGRYRLKIWFNDGKGDPSVFWVDGKTVVSVERPDTVYAFESKQRFATGMQVAKDPGVWPVYIGCSMMLLGLIVAFFLSHKRIWVYISEEEGQTRVLVAGTSNKNKVSFENIFDALVEKLEENETLKLNKV